jgi:GTP-binding protein
MGQPVAAIVGRPNVGKSTLLNRFLRRRAAIVAEHPGVTRDRKDVDMHWRGRDFRVVDTGGWLAAGDDLARSVSRQSERAVADADVVVFVVDVTTGVTDEDSDVADLLRRSGRPVVLVANKVDGPAQEPLVWELMSLGLGEPLAVSALHGRGSGDVLDAVVDRLPERQADRVAGVGDGDGLDPAALRPSRESLDSPASSPAVAVAIVGRPNVGKSTLFNRIVGDERAVVHDLPGTTRDAIDTVVETDIGRIRLIDTAGMRRRARISDATEQQSLVRALEAVDAADVALLVIDAGAGVTSRDQRLAERVDASGCPIVVLLNKWELLDAERQAERRAEVRQRLSFVGNAPVLPISARTGRGLHKLLPALDSGIEAYRRRVPTRQVNQVIQAAQDRHPAPAGARVLYATQGATDPPTFILFVNRGVPRSYLRYLERQLREAFGLDATPIKLRVRRRAS